MSLTTTQLETLTPQQVAVLHALATGTPVSQAANDAGIHRSTIHNWSRQIPAFAEALSTLREEHAELVHESFRAMADSAAQVVDQSLYNSSPALRLRAALAVLRHVASASRPVNHHTGKRSTRQNSTEFDTSTEIVPAS